MFASIIAVLTGPFSIYENKTNINAGKDRYTKLEGLLNDISVGGLDIVLTASIYVMALAFIGGAIGLIVSSFLGPDKIKEAKWRVVLICVITVLLFGLLGLPSFMQKISIK